MADFHPLIEPQKKCKLLWDKSMEPMAGIEPATDGLRNRCSTTELHWHRPTHSAAPKIEEATEAFAGAKQSLN